MNNINKLKVLYHGTMVGTLAKLDRNLTAFEYDKQWLSEGFSISPFSLPLEKKVFEAKIEPFGGIFGVFADSLPDGWGRILMDRVLAKNKIAPNEVGVLDRLAIVGNSGMGVLSYEPEYTLHVNDEMMDLDAIAKECSKILQSEKSDKLDELFRMGGSSGGARPKIFTKIDGEDWIIKFPSTYDKDNIGEIEYHYSLCAKKCGIEMAETRLFQSEICSGYFGTKRFDRELVNGKIEKKHMISVSGLLETSHRLPNLDYNTLMTLTLELTKKYCEVEKMFRLMCFNVFAHNRDDHSKNFTFLYGEGEGWKLSPAYDLTYSSSIGGEHATMVNGNGFNPGVTEILEVAKKIGINHKKAKDIVDQVKSTIDEYRLLERI